MGRERWKGDASRRTHGLSLHALSSGRWGPRAHWPGLRPKRRWRPGTVACCRGTRSLHLGKQTSSGPALVSQITLLKICCATLSTSEAAGLGYPSPSHRLRRGTNPGTLPEATPPSWKGRLQPKAGEHVWGRSQRCARKRWILPSSTRSLPTPPPLRCSQLHVPLPGSQVTGPVPGCPSPHPPPLRPLPGCPMRRPSPFSCLRVFLEKVLGIEKQYIYDGDILPPSPTPFQRDRAAMSPESHPPPLLLFL